MKIATLLLAAPLLAASAMAAAVAPAAPTAAPAARRQITPDDFASYSSVLSAAEFEVSAESFELAGFASAGRTSPQLSTLVDEAAAIVTEFSSLVNVPIESANANPASFYSEKAQIDSELAQYSASIQILSQSIANHRSSSAARPNAPTAAFGSASNFFPFVIAAAAAGGAAVVFVM